MHHREKLKHFLSIAALGVLLSTWPAQGKTPTFEKLPIAALKKMKQKPCTFVHVWATWCTICIQELPEALKVFASWKGITPVVLDVSSSFVQDNFSKKWLKSLSPSFTTYLKPDGKDEAYLEAIDASWSGALPFSVLFHKGKKKKSWLGGLDLAKLEGEIEPLCKTTN